MGLSLRSRSFCFLLYWALSLIVFRKALSSLVFLSWDDARYSHITLIPILCLGLIWFERRRIFPDAQFQLWAAPLVALGVGLYSMTEAWPANFGPSSRLLLAASAIVLIWVGGFVLFYGPRCARVAAFPLSLSLLAIPLPPELVESAEVFLQRGSADATHILFLAFSTPVHREGLVFSLPGITIEVAKECSGIRAAIALLITALLLSYMFLRSNWRRACCVMLVVPIAIIKNAIRIALLSWLGVYVSRDFLTGDLHHHGGVVFSLISLALLLPAVWLLRRQEEGRFAKPNLGPFPDRSR